LAVLNVCAYAPRGPRRTNASLDTSLNTSFDTSFDNTCLGPCLGSRFMSRDASVPVGYTSRVMGRSLNGRWRPGVAGIEHVTRGERAATTNECDD
jgi:hypothetical protein